MNEKLFELLDSVQKTAVRAGKTASNAAYAAGKKAEALADSARTGVQITRKRGEVQNAFRELGQMIYATHTGGPSNPDALLEKLQAVDALNAEIARLEIESGRADRVHLCPVCGQEVQAEDQFCGSCGAKL